MKMIARSAAAILALALSATLSHAAILNPGSAVPGAGGLGPFPTSAQLANLTSPAVSADIVAFIKSEVYAPDATNPLGGLTFVYTINNTGASTDAIGRFTTTNYNGFTTDIDYLGFGGVAPSSANRSGSGGTIGWNYLDANLNNTLIPGGFSTVIVHTDALQFAPNFVSVIDGSTTTTDGIGPAIGSGRTPEPASLSLLAIGGLAMLRRRK